MILGNWTVGDLRELVERLDWRIRQLSRILTSTSDETRQKDPDLTSDWTDFLDRWTTATKHAAAFIKNEQGKFGYVESIQLANEEYAAVLHATGSDDYLHEKGHDYPGRNKLSVLQARISQLAPNAIFDPQPKFYNPLDVDQAVVDTANKIEQTAKDPGKAFGNFLEDNWGKLLLGAAAVGVGVVTYNRILNPPQEIRIISDTPSANWTGNSGIRVAK